MRPSSSRLGLGLLGWVLLGGCAHRPEPAVAIHLIPSLSEPIRVDGRLDEACYQRVTPVTDFKVASRPDAATPETKVWLWWDHDGFWFAAAANDATLVFAPPSADEHAVDTQDRMEVFLWPEGSSRYYCLEVAPGNAVHDYSAQLYRRFEDGWSPQGAIFAAHTTAEGYTVEGFLPVTALRQMGIRPWQPHTRFHLGLYRADFRPCAPTDPLWLTWVEPRLPEPDFHVRATLAPVELVSEP